MKTQNIALVLIGGLAVGSQFIHRDIFRDEYRSREDCQRDWQQHPEQCEPAKGRSSGYIGSGYGGVGRFVGARYETGARPVTANPSLRDTSAVVQRGGFGFSGARYSGGG